MSLAEFAHWSGKFLHAFLDVPSWIEHLRQVDFVIGTRIHGTILGLQAGAPSYCVVYDSRTLELCQMLKIPYVLAAGIAAGNTRDDLLELFRFDADEIDQNRRDLAGRYFGFLYSNHLEPVSWVKDLGERSTAT